jgi:hypothetical protein
MPVMGRWILGHLETRSIHPWLHGNRIAIICACADVNAVSGVYSIFIGHLRARLVLAAHLFDLEVSRVFHSKVPFILGPSLLAAGYSFFQTNLRTFGWMGACRSAVGVGTGLDFDGSRTEVFDHAACSHMVKSTTLLLIL